MALLVDSGAASWMLLWWIDRDEVACREAIEKQYCYTVSSMQPYMLESYLTPKSCRKTLGKLNEEIICIICKSKKGREVTFI